VVAGKYLSGGFKILVAMMKSIAHMLILKDLSTPMNKAYHAEAFKW
jgi:hypothetical protein